MGTDVEVADDADNRPPATPEQTEAALTEEKRQQSRGRYTRADLLKMHAYRDAIRRTQGAYVLYPGDADLPLRGFHEVLPGLGAFALRPGGGSAAVAGFLAEVVAHVCNRASAREQQSFATYLNYRVEEPAALYQAYPERQGHAQQRHVPPRQTFVLVGWCKNAAHRAWIDQHGLYNFRMDDARGSLGLSPEVAGASYLLLHGENGAAQPGLLRVKNPAAGPKVFSRQTLLNHAYPGDPSQSHYLVYEVEAAAEFAGCDWDWQALTGKPPGAASGLPFAVSLQAVLLARRPGTSA
jgi:hypothetical protein